MAFIQYILFYLPGELNPGYRGLLSSRRYSNEPLQGGGGSTPSSSSLQQKLGMSLDLCMDCPKTTSVQFWLQLTDGLTGVSDYLFDSLNIAFTHTISGCMAVHASFGLGFQH